MVDLVAVSLLESSLVDLIHFCSLLDSLVEHVVLAHLLEVVVELVLTLGVLVHHLVHGVQLSKLVVLDISSSISTHLVEKGLDIIGLTHLLVSLVDQIGEAGLVEGSIKVIVSSLADLSILLHDRVVLSFHTQLLVDGIDETSLVVLLLDGVAHERSSSDLLLDHVEFSILVVQLLDGTDTISIEVNSLV